MNFKSKIGFIGGNYLLNLGLLKNIKPETVSTEYGEVSYYKADNSFFVLRHTLQGLPPHGINHKANISAFKNLGVKKIVSFNSVGSLKIEIKPGQIVVVSDYLDFNPPTFFEEKARHITPEISQELKGVLMAVLEKLKIRFHKKGIYFKSKGPRLETKAEVNFIKKFANVVGMTMASEATLAQELDLQYAALCFVDNYANGIIKKPLSQKEIEENQKKNVEKIEEIIREILRCSKKF